MAEQKKYMSSKTKVGGKKLKDENQIATDNTTTQRRIFNIRKQNMKIRPVATQELFQKGQIDS